MARVGKPVGVTVIGLKELQARLAKASAYEPKQVRAIVSSAAQIVVDEAIPVMKSMFVSDPSRLDGHLEDSLRTSASSSKRGISASIYEGSAGNGNTDNKVPFAGWWEFGGPRHKSNRPPNRRFVKKGRVLFPTVKKHEYRILRAVEQAMHELAKMIEGP